MKNLTSNANEYRRLRDALSRSISGMTKEGLALRQAHMSLLTAAANAFDDAAAALAKAENYERELAAYPAPAVEEESNGDRRTMGEGYGRTAGAIGFAHARGAAALDSDAGNALPVWAERPRGDEAEGKDDAAWGRPADAGNDP